MRRLVRDVEDANPGMKPRPTVTDLLIGLMEEGPQTPKSAEEVIRRKRAGRDDH